MCDTMVAVPPATRDGGVLFAKNSDRLRDEPQVISLHRARSHADDEAVACTHIAIPQARRTHAVLLSRPYWMWGAEMGANEHGVTIGNEALFARMPAPEEPALLGMDLVRLGLERGASAEEALWVMITLLERYGQGGNCAIPGPSHYHNSFIVADQRQAFVLETMGRHWLIEGVRAVRSISNAYTIVRPDRVSDGLLEHVRSAAWADAEPADFSEVLGDATRPAHASAAARCGRSTALLRSMEGRLEVASMFAILRDHGEAAAGRGDWRPEWPRKPSICSHTSDLEPRGQTTGSLVSDLQGDRHAHWVTASPTACLSIFKPLFVDSVAPDLGPSPGEDRDVDAYWWRHDALTRALVEDEAVDLAGLRAERDALEAEFRVRIESVRGGEAGARQQVVAQCWRDAATAEAAWARRLTRAEARSPLTALASPGDSVRG